MRRRTYGVTLRRTPPVRLPRNAGAPHDDEWRAWVDSTEQPKAVDLFCGGGGLSAGLEAAGYRVILAVDTEPWALETHRHNFAGRAEQLDLAQPGSRERLLDLLGGVDIDLLAGGPPCQPFSRAGRSKIRHLVASGARDSHDERRELWHDFLDLVATLKPAAVLMENVPDMALGDDTATLQEILRQLNDAGYEADARIVDTWRHGVPQHRQRLMVVGWTHAGGFSWPAEADPVTVRDAIGDLPELSVAPDDPVGAEELAYAGDAESDFARRARKHCGGQLAGLVHDHWTRPVRADDYEAFQRMEPGTLYTQLPDDLRRYRGDIFDDKYHRLDWDGLSRSITAHIAKDGYWYIHPEQHRTLTVREAARIQTFPDDFRFAGTRSHQFRQIGNAVPPALAEAIGAALLRAQRGDPGGAPRPSDHRRLFVGAIEGWAREDRKRAPWAYPSDWWEALVCVVFAARPPSGWPGPADVLRFIPDWDAATPAAMVVLETAADGGGPSNRVKRLARAVRALRARSLDNDSWAGTGLSRAEVARIELLAGERPGLLISGPTLRVAARFTGKPVDRKNRYSEGRMELAKLAACADEPRRVLAATHRLGLVVCTSAPGCDRCPLAPGCSHLGARPNDAGS